MSHWTARLARNAGAALLVALTASAVAASDPQALALLRKAEALLRPSSSAGVSEILIVRPTWQRTMRFQSHDDRTHARFRLEVLDPVKTRGTVFFKVGSALTIYLPKLRRVVAISPTMMHDEWMGSDFNNEDLLAAGTLIDDYDHRVAGREEAAGASVVRIESVPRGEAAVVWAGLMQRIREDGVPLEIEYRGAAGKAVRRLTFDDVREIGGRRVPTRWVMTPTAPPGQRTEIRLESVVFDAKVGDELFEPPAEGRHPP